jgi:amino acid adenylation domain-containing protein
MSRAIPLTFGEDDLSSSVPMRFQRVLAQLPPHQLAYVSAEERLTYQELAVAGQQLAAALVALLDLGSRGSQKAVALLLPPYGATALVGIMGVLASGHFYVPLDLVMGETMIRDILLECPPQAIITTTALQDCFQTLLSPEQQPPLLLIDALPPTPAAVCLTPPNDGQMVASIQYTSGSTGKPRGVIRTHASNIYASYLAYHDLDFAPGAHVSSLRSYAYGASQQPIFGGFLCGATIYALPAVEITPVMLYHWIAEQAISHLYVTVGLLRGLADLGETHPPLPSLQVIMTGGEPLYRADVERLYRLFPPTCKFVARLVSTETAIYTRFVIKADTSWTGDAVPGGYVARRSEVLLLDEERQPVARGAVGEIAVRNRFLAAGYWQRPEETAAKFLPDPAGGEERIFLTGDMARMREDGCLEFVGRKDDMVKVRGYRVELLPIEAALLAHPAVRDSVVTTQASRSGELRLVAYVVANQTPGPSSRDLRQALGAKLPHYMIPARFVFVDQLARKVNSKVDRATLPPPGAARPDVGVLFVAPRNDIEQQLADLWAEVLELDEVGVEDNFFDLGGDSLLLLRLFSQIEAVFSQTLPLPHFMANPKIAQLAPLFNATVSPQVLSMAASAPPMEPRLQAIYDEISRPGGEAHLRRQFWDRHPPKLSRLVRLLKRLPYGVRTGVLYWLVHQPWAQQRYWQPQIQLIRRFYAGLDTPVAEETMITNSLFYGLPGHYRLNDTWLRRTPPAPLMKTLIQVEGGEQLTQAKQQGRGVILTWMHTVASDWVGQLQWVDYMIGNVAGALQDANLNQPAVLALLRARQSQMGQQSLQNGLVVGLVPDGHYGESAGIVRPFHGRQRIFFTGFAELALQTGAPVLLMLTTSRPGQKVTFRLLAPLDLGSAEMSHAARVEHFMNQYLTHLDQLWRTMPWLIPWRQMEDHLACPSGVEPSL